MHSRIVRVDCNFVAGWEGADCLANIDDCVGNRCYYGSTCIDGINYYSCLCPPGRTGMCTHLGYSNTNIQNRADTLGSTYRDFIAFILFSMFSKKICLNELSYMTQCKMSRLHSASAYDKRRL